MKNISNIVSLQSTHKIRALKMEFSFRGGGGGGSRLKSGPWSLFVCLFSYNTSKWSKIGKETFAFWFAVPPEKFSWIKIEIFCNMLMLTVEMLLLSEEMRSDCRVRDQVTPVTPAGRRSSNQHSLHIWHWGTDRSRCGKKGIFRTSQNRQTNQLKTDFIIHLNWLLDFSLFNIKFNI